MREWDPILGFEKKNVEWKESWKDAIDWGIKEDMSEICIGVRDWKGRRDKEERIVMNLEVEWLFDWLKCWEREREVRFLRNEYWEFFIL